MQSLEACWLPPIVSITHSIDVTTMNINHYPPYVSECPLHKEAYMPPEVEELDLLDQTWHRDLLVSLSAEGEIDDFDPDGDL